MEPGWVEIASEIDDKLAGVEHGGRMVVVAEIAEQRGVSPSAIRGYLSAWQFLKTLREEDVEAAERLLQKPFSVVAILERWNRHDPSAVRALVTERLDSYDVAELKRREKAARVNGRMGGDDAPRLALHDLLEIARESEKLVVPSNAREPVDARPPFEAHRRGQERGEWCPPSPLWRRRRVGAVYVGPGGPIVAFELTSRSIDVLRQRAPSAVLTAHGLLRVATKVLIVVDGPREAEVVRNHGLGHEYDSWGVRVVWRNRALEARVIQARLR